MSGDRETVEQEARAAAPVFRSRVLTFASNCASATLRLFRLRPGLAEASSDGCQERLRLILAHSPVALAMFDRQMRYLAASRRWLTSFQIEEESILGRSHFDVVREAPEHWRQAHRRVLSGETVSSEQERRTRLNGQTQWLRWEMQPWRDGTGEIGGLMMTLEDVTGLRQAEEAASREHDLHEAIFLTAPVIVLLLDTEGRVLRFNPLGEQLTGRGLQEVRGCDWFDTFSPEGERERHRRAFVEALRGPRTSSSYQPILTKGGEPREIAWCEAPMRDADGMLVGLLRVGRDVTERSRAENAIRASADRLRMLLQISDAARAETTPEGVIAVAMEVLRSQIGADRVAWANLEADEDHFAFGGSSSAPGVPPISGQFRCSSFGPEGLKRLRQGFPFVADDTGETPEGADPSIFELTGIRAFLAVPIQKADRLVAGIALHSLQPRRWTSEEVELASLAAERIWEALELTRVSRALAESEERLRLAVRASRVGLWDWNLRTNRVIYSSEWKAQIGYEDGEIGDSFDEWESRVHPADHEPMIQLAQLSIDQPDSPMEREFRLRHRDGTWRWIMTRAEVIRDEAGTPIRMLGCHVDMTDRKRADEALQASEELQRAVLASLADQIVVLDREGRIIAVNPSWEASASDHDGVGAGFGLGANYVAIRRARSGSGAADSHRAADGIQAILDGKGEAFSMEYPCESDGRTRWYLLKATPLRSRSSGGAVVSHVDITERMIAIRKLQDREARLSAILNTASDAIITIDRRGIIKSHNSAASRLFGYSSAELMGQNIRMLMPSPVREEHDGYLARYLETGQARMIGIGREDFARRKDGSVFPVDVAVSEVDHLQQFTGIIRDATRRKDLEREVMDVASQEQRRIGQDLHDMIGQELTALNILAGDLADALRSDASNALPLVERITQGLRRCHQELRVVIRGLLPVPVDGEGLMAALADLADRTHESVKVNCEFECPRPVAVVDNLTATHLYLIAQEAVHNAVKHARPRSIWITLTDVAGSGPLLRVRDDGVGLLSTSDQGEGGLGLRIMRNRAAIIGAHLSVEPAAPGGTVVVCSLTGRPHA